MAHDAGPDHDRVRLTEDELSTLAALERELADEPTSRRVSRLVDAATAWRPGGGSLGRAERWLPWLALLGALTTLVAVTRSPVAGAVAASFTTLVTAWWCVRSGPGFYRRLAARR
jgi:hypothetical protein